MHWNHVCCNNSSHLITTKKNTPKKALSIQTEIKFVITGEMTKPSCVIVAVTPFTQAAKQLQKRDLSSAILATVESKYVHTCFLENTLSSKPYLDMNNSAFHSDFPPTKKNNFLTMALGKKTNKKKRLV